MLRWTTRRFEARGLPSARLDAEVLIAAALGVRRVQLYVQFERPLDPAELASIREFVRRRQGGESVAYVVGRKEFFGLDFAVDARVLVPRPDTETLVDETLARLRERALPAEAAVRVADVGTGSGAVLVALAKSLPGGAQLVGVDISADALEVARANAASHGIAATFHLGDVLLPLAGEAPFDAIVANLPYVPTGELATLAREVRAEPRLALDGGADGLALIRRLVAASMASLVPGGCLALELGQGQAGSVIALCRDAGFIDLRARRDLGTVERVVSALKPGSPPTPILEPATVAATKAATTTATTTP